MYSFFFFLFFFSMSKIICSPCNCHTCLFILSQKTITGKLTCCMLQEVNNRLVSLFGDIFVKMDRPFLTLIPLKCKDVVSAFEASLLCSASVSAYMSLSLASSRLLQPKNIHVTSALSLRVFLLHFYTSLYRPTCNF